MIKCKNERCGGIVDTNTVARLPIGCHAYSSAFPCMICGRLHYANGRAAKNHAGKETFLTDGRIINGNPESQDLF